MHDTEFNIKNYSSIRCSAPFAFLAEIYPDNPAGADAPLKSNNHFCGCIILFLKTLFLL